MKDQVRMVTGMPVRSPDDLLSVLLFFQGCYKTSPANIPLKYGSKFHTSERAELGLGSRPTPLVHTAHS